MSEPTDPIQALLTQVDHALHQLSPPIPQLVWGEGVAQSRRVLQQVRDYLTSLPSSPEIISQPKENSPAPSSEQVRQQLNHLQQEIETLQQERQRLMTDIQQLQSQSQSAILQQDLMAGYSEAATAEGILQGAGDFVDLPHPPLLASEQILQPPAATRIQQSTDISEDLSDIFGELQLNERMTRESLDSSSMTAAESFPVLDTAIHLDASEPPLDGQEYILASPHENLLPVDEEEDQVDSLLLVGRGTLQRLETELMSLEDALSSEDHLFPQNSDPDPEQTMASIPSLEQLSTQWMQNEPQSSMASDDTPLTFEALLDPSNHHRIPFAGTAHPEAESFSLKTLSQKFSQSSPSKNSQKPQKSED